MQSMLFNIQINTKHNKCMRFFSNVIYKPVSIKPIKRTSFVHLGAPYSTNKFNKSRGTYNNMGSFLTKMHKILNYAPIINFYIEADVNSSNKQHGLFYNLYYQQSSIYFV